MKNIKIAETDLRFMREPLIAPFGFKGQYLNELWQTAAYIKSENYEACCPCTISVLWSDARVFSEHTPAESSALMRDVTAYALEMIKGESFVTPDALINSLLPELQKYADKICGGSVAPTFVLNSLVGVDYALWTLYADENGFTDFDSIIPEYARPAMKSRYKELAHIPLVSYAVGGDELKALLDSGTGLLKIKIGKSCGAGLSKEEDMRSMLEWDKARLLEISSVARDYGTPLSKSGHVRFYLDANGRYDCKQRLEELLDYAEKIAVLDDIELIEEPFPPENESFVGDLPCVINADESAHSLEDVGRRISQGYKAVALKPIAKTMSVSFEMAAAVHKAGGQCLCADLTVVPLLAEWNKQFAARIAPLSGMNCGVLEINGDQNYKNWDSMGALLPKEMEFQSEISGVISLPNDFYATGGKLFQPNGYLELFNK